MKYSKAIFVRRTYAFVAFTVSILLGSRFVWARYEEAYTKLQPLEIRGQGAQNEDPQDDTNSFISRSLLGPKQSRNYSDSLLVQKGVSELADLKKIDAALNDAYNAGGYTENFSIRGVLLDSRTNYFRNGLPIVADTHLPIENKEQVQILRGANAALSGAGSPSGIINLETKRAFPGRSNQVQLLLNTFDVERSGQGLVLDINRPFAESEKHFARFILSTHQLNSGYLNSRGEKHLLGFSTLSKLGEDAALEAELEASYKSQPTQPGFSMWGDRLPSPGDPQVNINNQSWSQPVLFRSLIGSLRWTQLLSSDSQWQFSLGRQDARTDDRLTYPYGCSAESKYDRYCNDGTFDVYDYRSENEKRFVDSARAQWSKEIKPQGQQSGTTARWTIGVLASRLVERYQYQANNLVGTGNSTGRFSLPANPTASDNTTNRDFASSEVYSAYHQSSRDYSFWLGLKGVELQRKSQRLDGTRFISYRQNYLLPWVAFQKQVVGLDWSLAYTQGVESYVTPNKSGYDNRGQVLPAARSHQYELGMKTLERLPLELTWFYLDRPMVTDQSPSYVIDGKLISQGLELDKEFEFSGAQLVLSGLYVSSSRHQARVDSGVNGKKAVNVPEQVFRAEYRRKNLVVADLDLNLLFMKDSSRFVLPDNSVRIPGWERVDVILKYHLKKNSQKSIQAQIENIFDKKAWRESPYQYGHVYLYPLSGRQLMIRYLDSF